MLAIATASERLSSKLVFGTIQSQIRGNAYRAALGKISRAQYLRKYPVLLMKPDGSTFETRALEPRNIVQLAVDLKALSEDERRQRLAARKPKAKRLKKEVIDDNFDSTEYLSMWTEGNTLEKGNALASADKMAPQRGKKKSKKM